MSKTLKLGLLAFAVLGVTFLGCDKLANPIEENPQPVTTSDYPYTTDIMAGQTNDVGDITIYYTSDYIYVRYQTTGDWYLTEYHVAIASNCTTGFDPYLKNGNARPGQFPYKEELDTRTQDVLVEIPWASGLGNWWGEDELCFAAHCVVESLYNGEVVDTQTGWGEGEDFPGSDWSMHFCVPCKKVLRIPTEHVTSVMIHADGEVPDVMELRSVPTGYDVTNARYPSFCLDHGIYIFWHPYTETHIWSSYDPTMPDYCWYTMKYFGNQWVVDYSKVTPYGSINYLLNKIIEGGDDLPFTHDNLLKLQHCFWYYRGYQTYQSLTSDEKLLVVEADLHAGFYPSSGQYMALILDNGRGVEGGLQSVQLTFIVVDP